MFAQSQSTFGKKLEMARDFQAFLDAVKREIYLKHIIVSVKISIFGGRYRFSYRIEMNRDISPY